MPTRRALFLLSPLLAACGKKQPWSPLPVQRAYSPADDPPDESSYIWMNDSRADAYILSGVATGEASGWRRWTSDRFSLRIPAPPAGPLSASIHFDLIERFISEFGPFTLTLSVNGHTLTSSTFASPGEHHLSAPVPSTLSEPGQSATIEVTSDKVWIDRRSKARLAILLIAAGFTQQ